MLIRSIVIIGIIIGLCGCSKTEPEAQPTAANRIRDATWNYYMALSRLNASLSNKFQTLDLANPNEQYVSEAATHLDNAAAEIAAWPVLDVDPDLVHESYEAASFLRQLAQLLADLGPLLRERSQLLGSINQANESVWTLMALAVTGQGSELQKQADAHDQKILLWKARLEKLRADLPQRERQEDQLRATLTQRYHKEFPP